MEFIKTHKTLCIILGIVILLVVAGIVIFIKFSPNLATNPYGNRLTGIENYPISEERIQNMSKDAEQVEGIQSFSYDLKGRLINLVVKVNADLPKESAIQYANKTLEYFSEEEKAYYDLQIFFYTEEESEIYPIIGAKHKTSNAYVWKQE